mgnify:CR=1 FL=1
MDITTGRANADQRVLPVDHATQLVDMQMRRRLNKVDAKRMPYIDHRLDESGDVLLRMTRRRRDAQAFRALGDCRIIDRLDVDVMTRQQQIARRLEIGRAHV